MKKPREDLPKKNTESKNVRKTPGIKQTYQQNQTKPTNQPTNHTNKQNKTHTHTPPGIHFSITISSGHAFCLFV